VLAPDELDPSDDPIDRFPARLEWLDVVGSTNDVVAGWLGDGDAEVVVAAAGHQTQGRGRSGRSWIAPADAALLASVGFRPTWLAPDRTWRLAGIVGLAMADAAEDLAGLPEGTIRMKWPNDLVVAFEPGGAPITGLVDERQPDILVRKVAGLLGETEGLGTDDVRVVIGIGVNVDWPESDFPPDLAPTMTSLRHASGGRPVDRRDLLTAFLDRLETRHAALKAGYFDVAGWTSRQLTNGRPVRLERPDGSAETVTALGVDATTGALLVDDPTGESAERPVFVGEIRHLRIGGVV
jgi:BirA family biotin operon repressor/biotin-[acetyl-CoA-carboxylase] ligase